MRKILVTGSEGFVGTHLTKVLTQVGYDIVSTCHPLLRPPKGDYVPLDILNLEMTRDTMKTHKPDVIFHLAAISSVSKSFRDTHLTYNTNIMGTVNICEAARLLKNKVYLIFVSTCEVYKSGEGLAETSEIFLNNPYAVSKYAAELVCHNYMVAGLDCTILRPFTHTGPGQSEYFVLPTIAKQVAEIEQNKRPPLIEIGNTEVKREFMNVQDVVNAYKLAIEKCKTGEVYNIASNQGYTLARVLGIFKKLSKQDFEVRTDPSRIRGVDIPVLVGDGRKFSALTTWQPEIKIEKTVEDLLNYWRAKI